MRVVLDTSVLIDFYLECPSGSKPRDFCIDIEMLIEEADEVFVTELSTRVEIPRAVLNRVVKGSAPIPTNDIWSHIEHFVNLARRYPILKLTNDVLLLANRLYHGTKLTTQDAVMTAFSACYGMSLLTSDEKLTKSLGCKCHSLGGYKRLDECDCIAEDHSLEIVLARPS